MKLVFPVRKGGLGNQMFQIAAALVVHKEEGHTVVLPEEMPHIHNKFHLNYRKTIFQGFAHEIAVPLDSFAIQKLEREGFLTYPGEPGFEPWSPSNSPDKLILHGYFQYYPVLEPHKEFLQDFFRKNLGVGKGDSSVVGIHIRRGDFVKFSDIHYLQTPLYYRRAIYEIEKHIQNPKYRIFSDDIQWCKEQHVFERLPFVEFIDEANEIECLKKMIECEGGFICANSTYSWWAAFLGAYKQNSPILVPKNWMKGYSGSLFPREWIALEDSKGELITNPPNFFDLHDKRQSVNLILPSSKKVCLTVDKEETPIEEGIQVFVQLEPTAITNTDNFVLEHGQKYYAIITFNQKVLDKFPNAKKAILPAATWISGSTFRNIDIHKKQFRASCITGFKQLTEGHTFRHLVYINQQHFQGLPITFFRSSVPPHLPEIQNNPFLQEDKFPLFETYQYSIVIENSSQTNYFTEKLIDCLITKTIPIYYGCPNIHEYFDTTGWILLTSENLQERFFELVTKVKELFQQSNPYDMFKETIEKNYNTCLKQHTSYFSNINKALLSLPCYTEV